jgi:hypothetical protein
VPGRLNRLNFVSLLGAAKGGTHFKAADGKPRDQKNGSQAPQRGRTVILQGSTSPTRE